LCFQLVAIKVHSVKYVTAIQKEKKMTSITAFEIEKDYETRAAAIRCAEHLKAAEVPLETLKIGATVLLGLTAASEVLRPLFSWNPQRLSSNDEE
jgi:hypothetical protein